MYNWEYLSQFNLDNPPQNFLVRNKETQTKYSDYLNSFKNIDNYLVNLLFKNNEEFVLRLNDFPYDCENNIEHFVLWINPNLNIQTKDIINYINVYINNIGKQNKDIIYFENLTKDKSIKSIRHFHLFKRNISKI